MADATDVGRRWPLASATARLLWLQALCVVAEGADVPLYHTTCRALSSDSPARCVAAVLGDALHRVAVLGGREGMPRSLGSVYGGAVTRFLGGSLRGVVSRVIDTPGVFSFCNGIAASGDGSTLLVSGISSHAIHELSAADGSLRRVIGGEGDEPLRFYFPRQVFIAPDGFVFVAEAGNKRVQVLTPSLDLHCFIGPGELKGPFGVCANTTVVVVSQLLTHRISVFNRGDGSLLRTFGREGSDDGELDRPRALCLMSGDRHVAVADSGNDRVSVFSVEGEFIRHVGVGVLSYPHGVAVSAFDELVVADTGNRRLCVFSSAGDVLATVGDGDFTGVALHGSSVFAVDPDSSTVSVFT
jgi:DNA-binding beta-propeller fold protein YncE